MTGILLFSKAILKIIEKSSQFSRHMVCLLISNLDPNHLQVNCKVNPVSIFNNLLVVLL